MQTNRRTQPITPDFVNTPSGRHVIDDAGRFARVWVSNVALGNAMRALVHEVHRQDPTQSPIRLDTPAQAEALYALVKTAATEANEGEYTGSLTPEGLPVGADGLARYAAPGDRAQSEGRYWVKPVDFATSQTLGFEDAPKSNSVPVSIGPKFRAHLHDLMLADADAAIAKNPDLGTQAARAEARVESQFLRGGRQLRHGGYFPRPSRDKADLSPRELQNLVRRQQGARIGAAFGFGTVFRNQSRHGAGWC